MTGSLQPISTAAMSGLIQELEAGSSALFGDPFATTPAYPGDVPHMGKLARVLRKLREKTIPLVIRSMNMAEITVVYRSRVGKPEDPLGSRFSTSSLDLYAAVSGPTEETMAQAWKVTPMYDVLIPAVFLTYPLDENDGVTLDGTTYDVIGIQAYPQTPPPVAYRYILGFA